MENLKYITAKQAKEILQQKIEEVKVDSAGLYDKVMDEIMSTIENAINERKSETYYSVPFTANADCVVIKGRLDNLGYRCNYSLNLFNNGHTFFISWK